MLTIFRLNAYDTDWMADLYVRKYSLAAVLQENSDDIAVF